MAVLRSRRLQDLLGAPADSLTYQHLASLAGSGVGEAADLDFKEALYGASESNKRSLAVDVAAMANTLGGLVILGVAEDDQARAVSVPGVALSDDEVSRMRQIVAGQVMPMPAFDIRQLEDPATPGRGCLVVMVPPSPIAPHAVVIDKNSLRYPRRNGATTTYLSESDVAQAYRDRFTGLQSKVEATAVLLVRADRRPTAPPVWAPW